MNKAWNKAPFLLGALLLFISTISFSTNVILDLHGVLVSTNKMKIFGKTKPLSTIFYTISHFKNPRTALFDALETVPAFNTYTNFPRDEEGNPLPAIFCDYLTGTPAEKILETIGKTIGTSGALWNLAQGIFNPELFAESISFIEDGVAFANDCAEQGFDLYILSNMDTASYEIMKKDHPEFFDLFSGVVISGDCHLLKPDPAIYNYLIDKFKLNKADCVFIDDQPVNVEAGENAGISSIHCSKTWRGKPDFKTVRAELEEWLEAKAA